MHWTARITFLHKTILFSRKESVVLSQKSRKSFLKTIFLPNLAMINPKFRHQKQFLTKSPQTNMKILNLRQNSEPINIPRLH